MIPAAAIAAAPDGIEGEGIAADPYQIDTPGELRAITDWVNADPGARAGSHIDLTADIDMSAEAPLRGLDTFTGVLDGQGHAGFRKMRHLAFRHADMVRPSMTDSGIGPHPRQAKCSAAARAV